MQSPSPLSPAPREPAIEFLGKLATFGLILFRVATVVAAAFAVVHAVTNIADPPPRSSYGSLLPETGQEPIAQYFVWLCIGIPPLLPTRWLFGRGRWPVLGAAVALWFLPSLLDGDHEYGWLLRFFATLVAFSVLVVWKTVFGLTQGPRMPDPIA